MTLPNDNEPEAVHPGESNTARVERARDDRSARVLREVFARSEWGGYGGVAVAELAAAVPFNGRLLAGAIRRLVVARLVDREFIQGDDRLYLTEAARVAARLLIR